MAASAACKEVYCANAPRHPAQGGVRFQLESDLHLEMKPSYRVTPVAGAEYLILAGDIGQLGGRSRQEYLDFLTHAVETEHFKHIFVVSGNHEAYGRSIQETHNGMDALVSYPSLRGCVTHLQQRHFDIETGEPGTYIRVLGATLWSNVLAGSPQFARENLNDFHYIKGMGLGSYMELHNSDVQWIKAAIELAKVEPDKRIRAVVVVTHHAPLTVGTSHPQFDASPLAACFGTDLAAMMDPSVSLWAFGHTHFSNVIHHPATGTVVASNQKGYPGEEGEAGFVPNMVFVV